MMKWRALWRALSGCWGPYLVRSATVLPKKHWKQTSSSTSTPLTTRSLRRDLALAPRLPRFPRLLLPRAPRAAHRIRVGSFEEQLALGGICCCRYKTLWHFACLGECIVLAKAGFCRWELPDCTRPRPWSAEKHRLSAGLSGHWKIPINNQKDSRFERGKKHT